MYIHIGIGSSAYGPHRYMSYLASLLMLPMPLSCLSEHRTVCPQGCLLLALCPRAFRALSPASSSPAASCTVCGFSSSGWNEGTEELNATCLYPVESKIAFFVFVASLFLLSLRALGKARCLNLGKEMGSGNERSSQQRPGSPCARTDRYLWLQAVTAEPQGD